MPLSTIPRSLRLTAALAFAAAGSCIPLSAATERILLHIGKQHTITATMEDNAAARAFLRRLPIRTTLRDFNRGAEKIYRPENRLTAENCPGGCAPQPGDITIYLPWGNLAIFCRPSHYSEDLLLIGRIDHGGIQALQTDSDIPVRIERSAPGEPPSVTLSPDTP